MAPFLFKISTFGNHNTDVMKNRIAIITLLLMTGAGFSQSIPDKLFLASKDTKEANSEFLPIKLDLAYYSKNYNTIFGEYNFTLDSNNFGVKNVYIGHNDKYYYLNNSTFIMDMQSPGLNSFNFSDNADYLGGLYSAFNMIFNNEANYSNGKIKIGIINTQ